MKASFLTAFTDYWESGQVTQESRYTNI